MATANNLTPADEDDIREAVFRYQFSHNASAQKQNAKVYFLSLGKGKAPNNLFMLRFKDHKPPVRQVSFLASNKGMKGKEPGNQGLIFYVTKIEQISEDEVEVSGGYYEGALSSSGNIYRVKRTDNKWIVIEDRMIYIS